MAMKGKIGPISGSTTIDTSDQLIGTGWIWNDPTEERPSGKNGNVIVGGPDGALMKRLIQLVAGAKDMVCLSSFLIQTTDLTRALSKAAERGVPVYILTAPKDGINVDEEDIEDRKDIIVEHRKWLDSIAGTIMVRTASHLHAKFLLVDPKTRKKGILMTSNATKRALLEDNIEFAIELGEDNVTSLYSQFLHGFWVEATHELLRPGSLTPVPSGGRPDSVHIGEPVHPCTIGEPARVSTLKERIISLIRSAKNTVSISAWSFKDESVLQSLKDCHERGIRVTVFTKPNEWNTAALKLLGDVGVRIIGHDRFHAKVILVDGKDGLLMTANMKDKGLDTGFEAAVGLDKKEIETISSLLDAMEGNAPWTYEKEIRVGTCNGKCLSFTGSDIELIEIESKRTKKLPSVVVSVDELEDFTPSPEQVKPGEGYASEWSIQWSAEPRKVPSGAKRVKGKDVENISFPVYQKKGKRYLVISTWADIQKAKGLAKDLGATIVAQS